jgi:hypothetical protein
MGKKNLKKFKNREDSDDDFEEEMENNEGDVFNINEAYLILQKVF